MCLGCSSCEKVVETKLQGSVWHYLNKGNAQAAVQTPDPLVLHNPSRCIHHPSINLPSTNQITGHDKLAMTRYIDQLALGHEAYLTIIKADALHRLHRGL